jgi:hypothetical protein
MKIPHASTWAWSQDRLMRALSEHAAARPQQARGLHRWAAQVAESMGDQRLCATLLEQAAFSQGSSEDEGALWAQAGSLWNALGERERGAAALGRALSAGGEKTPGVLLALGDYAYDVGDVDGAARHYRGAGALAWPALAALFRAQVEKAREGAEILALLLALLQESQLTHFR